MFEQCIVRPVGPSDMLISTFNLVHSLDLDQKHYSPNKWYQLTNYREDAPHFTTDVVQLESQLPHQWLISA